MAEWKKKLLASGFAGGLVLAGLTGCGDGINQDNRIDNRKQMDDVDNENKNEETD